MSGHDIKKVLKWGWSLGWMLLALSPGICRAQKIQASLLTGGCRTFAYGAERDYALGENDFPVTPAHTSFQLGGALGVSLNDKLLLELDGRLVFSSPVTLEDPSDEDTVRIDTSNHLLMGVNLVYRLSEGRFRPYVLLGAGLDKVFAEDTTVMSEYGFEIIFEAPSGKESLDPMINIGTGGLFALNQRLALRLDARYVLIMDSPNTQNGLSLLLGLTAWF